MPDLSYMNDLLTARYNSNGTLDTSYGSAGWTVTDIYGAADTADAGLIQHDPVCNCEKFVIGGWAFTEAIAYGPRLTINLRFQL